MIAKFEVQLSLKCDIPYDIDNSSKFGVRFIAARVSAYFPSPEGLVMNGTEKLSPSAFVASPCVPCLEKVNLREG